MRCQPCAERYACIWALVEICKENPFPLGDSTVWHTGGGRLCQVLCAFHGMRLNAIQKVSALQVESQSTVGSYPLFSGLRFPMQIGQGE